MLLSVPLLALLTVTGTGGANNGSSGAVHTPHSVTSSVAFCERANGDIEMLILSRDDARVMSSLDHGFSFQAIAGDGLGKAKATRAVYYEVPASGEKVFVIGTDRGIWKYLPETGEVTEISTGLDADDRYITDVDAPAPGQDGPVVAVNSQGQIYLLDESTDTWTLSIDLNKFDLNAEIAIAPVFDRNGVSGPEQTILCGARGLLVESTDGGATWSNHPQFATVATDLNDFHIRSIAFDTDYATTGVVVFGRARDDLASPFGSEGELWRSDDFGANYTQVSVNGSLSLSSGVHAVECAGTGPDAQKHWFVNVWRFPERGDFDSGYETIGVLSSVDGGQTWDDQGSYQEFIQEFSGNERTAAGLALRRMIQIKAHPDFATNGEVWLARSEGLYVSRDMGSTWDKRRFRPSTQVRDITSGFNHLGEIVTFGASYGSGLYRFNHTTGQADTLIGDGVVYYASVDVSPNLALDGIVMGGGQRDLMIRFEEPAAARKQGWFSVNEIREAIDGNTGYVRSLAMPEDFSAVPGYSKVFAWSSRFEDTPLGETRMTLDGLGSVYLLNDLLNQPGQRAPHMHEMGIAKSFDENLLPRETDILGVSTAFDHVYRLLNLGTAQAPDFQWDELAYNFPSPPADMCVDPRFDRNGGVPAVWVITDENLYRLEDQSADWSTFQVDSWPGIEDFDVVDMHLSPDMDLEPTVYALTWGGGAFKLDLTNPSPDWEPLASGPLGVWGECLALSPDFENDRLIFAGTQDGLYYCQDLAGSQWTRVNQDILYDSANTSFDFYSPANPTNPDPARPWGWGLLKREQVPENIIGNIEMMGSSALYAEHLGDFCDLTAYAGSKISILTFEGTIMGKVRVTAWDTLTGDPNAPFHDVTHDLFSFSIGNRELEVPLPQAGTYTVRLEVTELPFNHYVFVDGIRLTD